MSDFGNYLPRRPMPEGMTYQEAFRAEIREAIREAYELTSDWDLAAAAVVDLFIDNPHGRTPHAVYEFLTEEGWR